MRSVERSDETVRFVVDALVAERAVVEAYGMESAVDAGAANEMVGLEPTT